MAIYRIDQNQLVAVKYVVCGRVYPGSNPHVKVWLKLDPEKVLPEEGFSRGVRAIGHYGTGDLEVVAMDQDSLKRAKALIQLSYQEN